MFSEAFSRRRGKSRCGKEQEENFRFLIGSWKNTNSNKWISRSKSGNMSMSHLYTFDMFVNTQLHDINLNLKKVDFRREIFCKILQIEFFKYN